MADGLLPQVGVQGGHNQVLAEGGDGPQEPLLPRLSVDADRVSGLEAEADKSSAEWLHNFVRLIVVYPLIVSEDQLFEHFSTFLLFVLLAEHVSGAQTFLIPVSSDRILPNFVDCINIVLFDEFNMSLLLLLNIPCDTNVCVRLLPIAFFVLFYLGSKKRSLQLFIDHLLLVLTLF